MTSEYIHFDFDFYYKDDWHTDTNLTEKQLTCIRDTIAQLDTMCKICKCQYYPWKPEMLPYPPEVKYRNRSCQHGTILNEFMAQMVTLAKEREYETIGELRIDSPVAYTLEQLPKRMHGKLKYMVYRMNLVCSNSDNFLYRFRDRGSFYCEGGVYKIYNNVKQLVWKPDDLLAKRGACFVICGFNAQINMCPFGENDTSAGVPVYTGGLCKACRDYIEDHWKTLAEMFAEYNTERMMYLSTMQQQTEYLVVERLEPIPLDINNQPLVWYAGLPRHIQRFILDACSILNGNCTISSDSYYQRGAAMDTDCNEVAWTPEAIIKNRDYCGVACYQPDDEYMCKMCDVGIDYVWGYISQLVHDYNLVVNDLSTDKCNVNFVLLEKYNELLARGYLAELAKRLSSFK